MIGEGRDEAARLYVPPLLEDDAPIRLTCSF
jgi:hypothetical protein